MPTEDRDQRNEDAAEEVSLSVEDLNPPNIEASTAEAVKGGITVTKKVDASSSKLMLES
jgi:hypothetical protein